jgi:hypothetical protein
MSDEKVIHHSMTQTIEPEGCNFRYTVRDDANSEGIVELVYEEFVQGNRWEESKRIDVPVEFVPILIQSFQRVLSRNASTRPHPALC